MPAGLHAAAPINGLLPRPGVPSSWGQCQMSLALLLLGQEHPDH